MGRIEVNIQKSIYDKLQEMSDILKINIDELINLSLIDGYSLYWFLFMKKILNLSEEDLAVRFHERYELLQEIEKIESEFESKYPYGHFTENYERYMKFLNYINAFKDLKVIEQQEVKEVKKVPPRIPETQKVSKDKRKQKKTKQTSKLPMQLLPKRRIPLILFSLLTTFLIFWSIRDYFNPIEMLRYNPPNFIGYMALAIFTLIIMGMIYSGILYFFHKYRKNTPFRAETKIYRNYKKEFNESNPKSSYSSKTDRLIALGEFLEAKKRALPLTRH